MYGIKINGEWVTQDGRILVSRSQSELEGLNLGSVLRVPVLHRLRRSVDLGDAFRPGTPRVLLHTTSVLYVDPENRPSPKLGPEVDQIIGDSPGFRERVANLDAEDLEVIASIVETRKK